MSFSQTSFSGGNCPWNWTLGYLALPSFTCTPPPPQDHLSPTWGLQLHILPLSSSLIQSYTLPEGLCVGSAASVVSNSATPRTVARQAPLVCGILQARILEWVVMLSSRASSRPRDRTQVSCIASGFFTHESPGKPTRRLPRHYRERLSARVGGGTGRIRGGCR